MPDSRHPKEIARVATAFESQSIVIRDIFEAKNKLREAKVRAASPFDSAWGTFKRDAYALIRRTKSSEGGHNVIKHLVGQYGVEPARLRYKGNEFYWGLLAIDSDHDVLNRKAISLFARQMTYADLHEVPAQHLVGFLYQCGSTADITRKLKANTREPGFGSQHFK